MIYKTEMIVNLCGAEVAFDVQVNYVYHKACRGARERGTGLQLEPDEPAGVEILSIRTPVVLSKDWLDISWMFSEKMHDVIAEEILDSLRED